MFVEAKQSLMEGWTGPLWVRSKVGKWLRVVCLDGEVNFYLHDTLWFDIRNPESSSYIARKLAEKHEIPVDGGVTFGLMSRHSKPRFGRGLTQPQGIGCTVLHR